MAYTTDLVTVLKSLFDIVKPTFSEGTMWLELNKVFQAYGRLDPREQIHRRICANFQQDQQISDPGSFRRELRELLLEREPPHSGSERNGTGSWNARDTRARPGSSSRTTEPPSSSGVPTPSLGVTASSPKSQAPSHGVSAQPPGGPAPSPGGPTISPGVPKPTHGVASPSPGDPAPPPPGIETRPPPPKPPVWRRFFPCLAPCLQHS